MNDKTKKSTVERQYIEHLKHDKNQQRKKFGKEVKK